MQIHRILLVISAILGALIGGSAWAAVRNCRQLRTMLLITYYMNPETGRPWKKR
jgi:hypothetical protein